MQPFLMDSFGSHAGLDHCNSIMPLMNFMSYRFKYPLRLDKERLVHMVNAGY